MPMRRTGLAAIPRGIWVLGLVSLTMDLSSELIHALLPLYMAGVLGASTLTIGIIEGIAEATALIVKLFSGVLSDLFRRRKPLAVLGYGLAALTKFIFPLAPTLGWIVAARFGDRVGKGIRGAPRDALMADLAPAQARGASFGLRQALDTVGGVGGPLLAIGAMALFAGDFKAAFWIAVIPAVLSVALLVVGVDEPVRAPTNGSAPNERLHWSDARRLPRKIRDRRRHRGGVHARPLQRGVSRAARTRRRAAGRRCALGDGDHVDRLCGDFVSGGRRR